MCGLIANAPIKMEWGATLVIVLCVLLTLDIPVFGKDVKSMQASLGLQCPSCDKIQCTPRRAKRLKCSGGITRGVCNCCPVCAKLEGQTCGGYFHAYGKCDNGLYCDSSKKKNPWDQSQWKTTSLEDIPEGVCRKAPLDKLVVMDQPYNPQCKPKCTAEYCKSHRKGICSAVDNAERKQKCQGDCQHTSCSACRFVHPEPQCIKCRQDDFKCIRKFAKCIKQEYCKKDKFPCRNNNQDEHIGAKFQCIVPECLP